MRYGFYITHSLPELGLGPAIIGWAGTKEMAERFIWSFSDADKINIEIVPV